MFSDIYISSGGRVFSYRSGTAVYEETFADGRLLASGWNGAGFTLNVLDDMPTRLDANAFAEPQSFMLEADGRQLLGNWSFIGQKVEKRLNEAGNELTVGTLSLKHDSANLALDIHTELDGTNILTRYLTIKNNSDKATAIGHVAVLCGGVEITSGWRDYIASGKADMLYTLGYMEDDEACREGDYRRHALPNALYTVTGRYRSDRHRHPMFILKNNATGTVFTAQFAWSAGYAFDFGLDANGNDARLYMAIHIDSPSPFILLSPGESYETPAVHIGIVYGSEDEAVNEMHAHMRKSVFTAPPARGVYGWVEAGMGPERLMDIRATKHFTDTAAALGAETMIIDAGWYCPPGTECSEWWPRVGDWKPDDARYPNGISEIRDYIHEKGLLFGLWVELERVGFYSAVYMAHPEYTLRDAAGNPTTVLNMTNPDAAAWAENELARVITDYGVDLFRLDYNVGSRDTFRFVKRNGEDECCAARYYKAVYAMYKRLHSRFPDVIFENCASGGGRTDVGLVSSFDHTWVSDWQVAPRSARITNGMTMALPPERVDRLVSGMNCHTRASLDFMVRQTLFGRPTTNDYNAVGSRMNPEQIDFVRHSFDIYKQYIRPYILESRIYHHTPELCGREPSGVMVIERAAGDGAAGVIGVFRLVGGSDETVVYPRGVNRSKNYSVRFDNAGTDALYTGAALADFGVRIRTAGPLTSELIVYDAI